MKLGRYYERTLLENPVLSVEKERELIQGYQGISDEDERVAIQDRIVNANLRFVLRKVNGICRNSSILWDCFEELVQEGNIGLIKALEKYEIKKGARFLSYADYWIRQRINRALKKITKRKLSQVSLSNPLLGSEEDSTLEDLIPDPNQPPVDGREGDYQEELIAVNELPEREREIIYGRFGLNNHPPQRLEDLSSTFGVSRERVRQIQKIAIRKLKRRLRGSYL